MAEKSGRLQIQSSIINSETFFYGGLRDSGQIHEQLTRTPIDLQHETAGRASSRASRSIIYEQHEDGSYDVTFTE